MTACKMGSVTSYLSPQVRIMRTIAPYYPAQMMLEMGVFEGRYLNDCTGEFPPEWFVV